MKTLLATKVKVFQKEKHFDSESIKVSMNAKEFEKKNSIKGLRAIENLLHEHIDSHCEHSFDCCGHWYAHVSDIKRIRNKIVFQVFSYQNI